MSQVNMSENGCDTYADRDRSPIRDDCSDDDRRDDNDRRRPITRGKGGGGRRAPAERRVYISNIPYEVKWQDVKDLFVKEVGEVTYVNLFKDESGKARGCGIIEFATEDSTRDAIDKMHRYKLNGREMVVKEDTDKERDRYGYIVKDGGGGGGGKGSLGNMRGRDDFRPSITGPRDDPSSKYGNTYGLNVQFLQSLGIEGPLVSRIFVANLDYKVDEKKLKEIFKLSGKVRSCEIHKDKEGNSKGYGTIDYEHPVEAVQAISMFKDQVLFERKMAVRMDSAAMREEKEGIPTKLPFGLKGIGMGLGSGGAPLKNVSGNVGSGTIGGSAASNIGNTAALGNLVNAGALAGAGLGNLGLANAGLNALNAAATLNAGLGTAGLAGGAVGLGAGLGSLGATTASGLGVAANLQANSGLMGNQGGGFNVQSSGGYGGDNRRGSSSNRNDTLIVRNLPHHYTFNLLRERFREAGDVVYTEIRDKGVGLVRFSNEKDAQRAINLFDRTRIEGHSIDVYFY